MEQRLNNGESQYADIELNIWDIKGFEDQNTATIEDESSEKEDHLISNVVEMPGLGHDTEDIYREPSGLAEIIEFPKGKSWAEANQELATESTEGKWEEAKAELINNPSEASRKNLEIWETKRQEEDRSRVLEIMHKIEQMEENKPVTTKEGTIGSGEILIKPYEILEGIYGDEYKTIGTRSERYSSNRKSLFDNVSSMMGSIKEKFISKASKEQELMPVELRVEGGNMTEEEYNNSPQSDKLLWESNRLTDIYRAKYDSFLNDVPILGKIYKSYKYNMTEKIKDTSSALHEGRITIEESWQIVGPNGLREKPSRLKSFLGRRRNYRKYNNDPLL